MIKLCTSYKIPMPLLVPCMRTFCLYLPMFLQGQTHKKRTSRGFLIISIYMYIAFKLQSSGYSSISLRFSRTGSLVNFPPWLLSCMQFFLCNALVFNYPISARLRFVFVSSLSPIHIFIQPPFNLESDNKGNTRTETRSKRRFKTDERDEEKIYLWN